MSPAELWALPYDEFNKYRRENDLPKLFKFFEEKLPKFIDWLEKNHLTTEFILNTDKPGHFLYWDTPVYVIEYQHEGVSQFMFIDTENNLHESRIIESLKENPEQKSKRFMPYTAWIDNELKSDLNLSKKYPKGLDPFRYTMRSAPDVPEYCTATLSGGFTVLKLGGLKLEGWGKLLGRNLDFTNLDHLQVEGDWSNNSQIEVFYSSMEKVSLSGVQVNFTKFFQCEFRDLKARDTGLHWVEFFKCDVFGLDLKDSWTSTVILAKCSVSNLSFDKVEVDQILYQVPDKEHFQGRTSTFKSASANFKKLRLLYQSNGLRSLAAESYYNERFYEMKHVWGTSRMWDVVSSIKKGKWDFAFSYFKMHGKKLLTSSFDFLSYLLWGFGERPARVFIFSIVLILGFSLIYYSSNVEGLQGNAIDSVYLSTILFSTLGFGDYAPYQTGPFKLVLAIESLLGAFMLGLFVAGYSNKARY